MMLTQEQQDAIALLKARRFDKLSPNRLEQLAQAVDVLEKLQGMQWHHFPEKQPPSPSTIVCYGQHHPKPYFADYDALSKHYEFWKPDRDVFWAEITNLPKLTNDPS